MHKFDLFGFSPEIKDWLFSFVTGRLQRTCINGVYSEWAETKAGVPQGSVLGPILFLLMINDLPKHLEHDARLFADDTSILFTHDPKTDITDVINDEMTRLQTWADMWMIDLNPTKTKCMHVTFALNHTVPSPSFRGTPIELVNSHKHLGLIINNSLTWTDHIDYISTKVAKRIGLLRSLKFKLSRSCLKTIYIAHIRSILEYCDFVWDGCSMACSETVERLQVECMRIITGLPVFCRLDLLYQETGLEALCERRRQHRLVTLFKAVFSDACPPYFKAIIPTLRQDEESRNNRRLNTFEPYPFSRKETYLKSYFPRTTKLWNTLTVDIRTAPCLSTFKRLIRQPPSPVPSLQEMPRFLSILYTKLKCLCSGLNAHLFHSNLVPSPRCACGTGVEDVFHYLYNCPFYDLPREMLMFELDELGIINLSIPYLLHCDAHLSPELIPHVQQCVYRYISSTRRFT